MFDSDRIKVRVNARPAEDYLGSGINYDACVIGGIGLRHILVDFSRFPDGVVCRRRRAES